MGLPDTFCRYQITQCKLPSERESESVNTLFEPVYALAVCLSPSSAANIIGLSRIPTYIHTNPPRALTPMKARQCVGEGIYRSVAIRNRVIGSFSWGTSANRMFSMPCPSVCLYV